VIQIKILWPLDELGHHEETFVYVPSVPRVGDHIEHSPTGRDGRVDYVIFYWDVEENLVVEVRVK